LKTKKEEINEAFKKIDDLKNQSFIGFNTDYISYVEAWNECYYVYAKIFI